MTILKIKKQEKNKKKKKKNIYIYIYNLLLLISPFHPLITSLGFFFSDFCASYELSLPCFLLVSGKFTHP